MPYGFVSFPFEKATMLSTKEETRQWEETRIAAAQVERRDEIPERIASKFFFWEKIDL